MSNSIRNYDPNDDPVTYSASGLPEGLSINVRTGLISGTVELRPDRSADNHSPRRDDDVQPDLLIDPPDHNPDHPPGPPTGTDP
jgi:hypothetical protein